MISKKGKNLPNDICNDANTILGMFTDIDEV